MPNLLVYIKSDLRTTVRNIGSLIDGVNTSIFVEENSNFANMSNARNHMLNFSMCVVIRKSDHIPS